MIKINQNFNIQKTCDFRMIKIIKILIYKNTCDFCMIKINLNFLKYNKHVIFTIFKNITVLILYV